MQLHLLDVLVHLEEFEKMMDVYEAHMERGWIEQDEQEYRDSIIKKYYPTLEDAYNINMQNIKSEVMILVYVSTAVISYTNHN